MMCYRDRSFCNRDDCKKKNDCNLYFSDEHKAKSKQAQQLVQFSDTSECYKETNK